MATLLSVNVGVPRDVSWRGNRVHTGIWKRPVEGPRMVRRLRHDLEHGHFGENFTVVGAAR